MPLFVPEFIKSALALLVMTWLGVAGLVDEVSVELDGLAVKSSRLPSLALGGVAYYGYRGNDSKAHELGHLQHEAELGVLYLPVAGLSSAVGNVLGLLDVIEEDTYYGMWTERMADEYGGVER